MQAVRDDGQDRPCLGRNVRCGVADDRDELANVPGPLANDVSKLGEVPAQRVDQLGPLTHEQVARTEHHCRSLSLRALALDEPHRRALRRLANRFRVGHVVLLPLHKRLHVGWWDEPRVVTCHGYLARPVMSTGARLHRDHASRKCREERQHLITPQLLAEHDCATRTGAVNLENRFGQIDSDRANLAHGRLLQWCHNTSTLARRCRQGASTPTLPGTARTRFDREIGRRAAPRAPAPPHEGGEADSIFRRISGNETGLKFQTSTPTSQVAGRFGKAPWLCPCKARDPRRDPLHPRNA
ncbi:hypothetical protein ES708_34983 [subsurface metagenome]